MDKYLTVSEINKYIKTLFVDDFILNKVFVKGEVSGFKESRGNFYFNLKDENSVISCIMFEYNVDFQIEDGMTVLIEGRVSVYEKSGKYSIYVKKVENAGLGQYYIQLEALKKKLNDNGMFDISHKKEIPKYSMNIGVVTAKNGAAIKDIEITIRNRNPFAKIVLYPAKVQGDNASSSISKGIDILDTMNLDVIIVGRGGGSLEDLMPFNDSEVAYSIFVAKTPIISAVGHEINNSIADMVADLRVATPTAAAISATFDYRELLQQFENYENNIYNILLNKTNDFLNIIEDYNVRLGFLSPDVKINNYNSRLKQFNDDFYNLIYHKLNSLYLKFDNYNERVKASYPFSKLNMGMAFISNEKNKKVKSIKDVSKDEKIIVDLKDGRLKTKIIEIIEKEY